MNPLAENEMKRTLSLAVILVSILVFASLVAAQQAPPASPSPTPSAAQDQNAPPAAPPQSTAPEYKAKYPGDPAKSDSEALAIAYMKVVIRAQKLYNKQHNEYATSLHDLVHIGTFTQRMVNPNRGDYTVGFKGEKDKYVLTMTPRAVDATHRSFYAEDDGKIHADDDKAADADSPVITRG